MQKLTGRGFAREAVEEVLQAMQREGLQSDHRFTDAYIQSRAGRGYGPRRISQELRQKGIVEDEITAALESIEMDWQEQIARVRSKKYGQHKPEGYEAVMRQKRFLEYRGFTGEQIRQLFRQISDD